MVTNGVATQALPGRKSHMRPAAADSGRAGPGFGRFRDGRGMPLAGLLNRPANQSRNSVSFGSAPPLISRRSH